MKCSLLVSPDSQYILSTTGGFFVAAYSAQTKLAAKEKDFDLPGNKLTWNLFDFFRTCPLSCNDTKQPICYIWFS